MGSAAIAGAAGPGRLALPGHHPAGLRESVFEPFASTRRGDGGQGLGLAIARGFSEAKGGGLRVEATPGGGTTMVVELRTGP